MSIQSMLRDSFAEAKDKWMQTPASDRDHQEMSSDWVEALAAAFRIHYQADPSTCFRKDLTATLRVLV